MSRIRGNATTQSGSMRSSAQQAQSHYLWNLGANGTSVFHAAVQHVTRVAAIPGEVANTLIDKTKEAIDKTEFKLTITPLSPLENNNNVVRFKDKRGYSHVVYLFQAPTNNCQMSSIGQIANLKYMEKENIPISMKRFANMTSNLLLADIKNYDLDIVLDIMKPYTDIITNTKYKSTNNSDMNLILFKWKIELKKKEEDYDMSHSYFDEH